MESDAKWNFDGAVTYGFTDKTALQYQYHGLNDKLGGIGLLATKIARSEL